MNPVFTHVTPSSFVVALILFVTFFALTSFQCRTTSNRYSTLHKLKYSVIYQVYENLMKELALRLFVFVKTYYTLLLCFSFKLKRDILCICPKHITRCHFTFDATFSISQLAHAPDDHSPKKLEICEGSYWWISLSLCVAPRIKWSLCLMFNNFEIEQYLHHNKLNLKSSIIDKTI